MTNTATVETLTAEVRVLMVGNRQITLSVAGQLDRLDPWHDDPDEFEPFGRIKTGLLVEHEIQCRGQIGPKAGTFIGHDGYWWKRVKALPVGEFIGKRVSDWSLVRYVVDDQIALKEFCREEKNGQRWDEWCNLPLIVLAGLR